MENHSLPDSNPITNDDTSPQKDRRIMPDDKSLFGIKLASVLSKLDFESCEPELVVNMLRNPSMKIFSSLNRKLKAADGIWIENFMDLGGFEVLFDLVEVLSARRVTQMTDAMLLLENISCVKSIMNSRIGMDYFIMHVESGRKLVKALDTNNIMVKKHILELFSALTAFSTAGFHMTLDSLESYKLGKKKRYRFSVILNEVHMNKNMPSYWTTLLGLINCLVLANDDLYDRVKIRNEFIGLRLLEILDEFREFEDEDLLVQCDVFFEEMHADDDEMTNLRPECIDINSHRQVFDTIFQQICDKPQAASFLTILQCMMQIESDANSETPWLMIEDFVRRSVYGERKSLNCSKSEIDISAENYRHPATFNPFVYNNLYSQELNSSHDITSSEYKKSSFRGQDPVQCLSFDDSQEQSISHTYTENKSIKTNLSNEMGSSINTTSSAEMCSINTTSSGEMCSINTTSSGEIHGIKTSPSPKTCTIKATSSAEMCSINTTSSVEIHSIKTPPSPEKCTIKATSSPEMCSINTTSSVEIHSIKTTPSPEKCTIHATSSAENSSVKSTSSAEKYNIKSTSSEHNIKLPGPDYVPADMPSVLIPPKPKSIMKTLNWAKVSTVSASKKKVVWNDILDLPDPVLVKYDVVEGLFSNYRQTMTDDERDDLGKQPSMVSLLDRKKNLQVNIVLKQFKISSEELIRQIKLGDEKKLGIEGLKALTKVIPEGEELEMLTIYEGDIKFLSTAERFCIQLINLPEYALTIEVMLLKCEFGLIYSSVLPLLKDITAACRALLANKSLKEFLRFVLHTGNFINAGGYIGGALGFKISSLPKLIQIRSNKPKITLLHYLVEELEKENRHVMEFVEELSPLLERTYWLSLMGLTGEVDILFKRVKDTEFHLKSCSDELRSKCETFMQLTRTDIATLVNTMNETIEVKDQLANHFCEEVTTFRLEQCLETYKTLCDNIKKCKKENVKRLMQEEQSKKKKKDQKNEMENKSASKKDEDKNIIEKLLWNIKGGTSLRRIKKSCI